MTIDSVEYELTEQWHGQKIDSLDYADKTKLVQLPNELTYQDYRIFLTAETRDAFVQMAEAAKRDSITLIVDSGYRSPEFQARIIKRRMKTGESFARVIRFVAPPGYSQHHTGKACDLVPSEVRFAKSRIYNWLKENASMFGFYETYPNNEESKLSWEPWHWFYKKDNSIE